MEYFDRLSSRERQVARLVLKGKSNKMIASALGITESTVEFHLKNIYTRLNVRSRMELVLKLGYSVVDGLMENRENGERFDPLLSRARPGGASLSILIQEFEMKFLLKPNTLVMLAGGLLLLFVNWLAFHDLREPHTVRDWLMLAASAFVWAKFTIDLWNGYRHSN